MALSALLRCIDGNREWVLRTLKEYLRIESVSAQGKGIREAAEFLQALFTSLGGDVQRCEAGGPPVLVATFRRTEASRTILFYNHYDVQPADPLEAWISPPFEPVERDGMLFARGVADNKANLVARMAAVKAYRDLHLPLPVNVVFVVEGEEEIGSKHLSNFFDKFENSLQGDLCIWESSYRDENGCPQIILGCKGLIHGELQVRAARSDLHSSRAVIVPSAAWRLVQALAAVRQGEDILIRGFTDDIVTPDDGELALVRDLPFDEKGLRQSLGVSKFVKELGGFELKRHFFYAPTFNICGLTSGYQGPGSKTVLPCEARAKFDIRLVPDMRPDDIVAKLRRHLDECGFSDVEIHGVTGYPPARTPYRHPFVSLVREAGRGIWDKDFVIYPHMIASGPMHLFRRRMPCIGIGVGHARSNIHAPNENIVIEDFHTGTKHVANLLSVFARG